MTTQNSPLTQSAAPTLTVPKTRPTPARHSRKCAICRHKLRPQIELDFLHWHSSASIATEFQIADVRAIYRHAHATGLYERRNRNLRSAAAHIVEQVESVVPTAKDVLAAIRTISLIDSDGVWHEPTQHIIVEHLDPAPQEAATSENPNRHSPRLETAATPTKQSPAPPSNRHQIAPSKTRETLQSVSLKSRAEAYMSRFLAKIVTITALLIAAAIPVNAQTKLSTHWEELTADDFRHAIAQAQGTCVLPFGILEKHGPQLPLGTDLIDVRYASEQAAQQEYVVIFPAYYFGQIAEAKHEPGVVAYSREIQLNLLQETTDEMSRNGCKKIIIVNGHGGNESLLPYFAQTQLNAPHDYVVYIQWGGDDRRKSALHKDDIDMHAGQSETSNVMVSRPDLVHLDRVGQESGADQARVKLPPTVYTGIWWYAKFPNHYAGDASTASKQLGQELMTNWIDTIVGAIRAVKADDESLKLQNEFYEEAKHPNDTKQ